MRTYTFPIALSLLLGGRMVFAQQVTEPAGLPSPDDQYIPGPDWQPQPGVTKGKTFEFTLDHSKLFPETSRMITVYIPAEYTADKPACVYVGLDGIVFHAPGFDYE